MDPMQMNNMSSMMSMMGTIQKIGKGNRKYSINFDKNDKKFLGKFIIEVQKQFADSPQKGNNLYDFFNYVKAYSSKKTVEPLKVNYEEYEFLKKMIKDSLKGMEAMLFPWYHFMKKISVMLMKKQYAQILAKFK
jgi:hypothetical protein